MARRKSEAAINEVSNDEIKSRVKPRPRKKQAVTKTNSAATKALIRKNAATSSLLQLPSEVRENILINLVGDQLIHIKYIDAATNFVEIRNRDEHLGTNASEDAMSDSGDTNSDEIVAGKAMVTVPYVNPLPSFRQVHTPATFRHAICVANQSEQSAYYEATSGYTEVPEGESPEFYVASCEERHAVCKMCGSNAMPLGKEDRQALQVDLNVLGVCRQLYEEANHLLWTTNTFSFEDPRTFQKFFSSLNPAQKRNLTSIHISTNIGSSSYIKSDYHRAREDRDYWGTALNMSTMNMLRGVQALHLCLNQSFQCVSLRFAADSAKKQIEDAQQADMKFILRLRALSVTHATVVVSDDAENLESLGRSAYRWTAMKKTEYAESIRAQLMDPSGAELAKAEAETASLARKAEIRDNAAAGVRSYKSMLKLRQADVARLTRLARSKQTKAVFAAQKAEHVSKKSSKKAAKLQRDAKERKETAAEVRQFAEFAVERENDCRKHLADAREKHKRAMVRLGATPEDIQDMEDAEMLMEGLSGSDMDLGEDETLDPQSEDNESLVSQSEDETLDEDDEDDEVSS